MKRRTIALAVCMSLFSCNLLAEEDIAIQLKSLLETYYQAWDTKDLNLVVSKYHPESTLAELKDEIKRAFKETDIKHKILSFSYIGQDGEYAFARLRCRYEMTFLELNKWNLKKFEKDEVIIFRRQNAKWLIWTATELTSERLYESSNKELESTE